MKKKNRNWGEWFQWLFMEWIIPLVIIGLIVWLIVMISRMI